jgi:hypothetical protein
MSPYRDSLSTLSFALALLDADLMIFYHTTLLRHEDRLASDLALGISGLAWTIDIEHDLHWLAGPC